MNLEISVVVLGCEVFSLSLVRNCSVVRMVRLGDYVDNRFIILKKNIELMMILCCLKWLVSGLFVNVFSVILNSFVDRIGFILVLVMF